MSVFAINGAAGCGKTYTIMEKLAATLQEAPLKPSQKVLALTFMHGSRLRLESKLKALPNLKKNYQCLTIDSFAYRICTRWKSLLLDKKLKISSEEEYDLNCRNAAMLMDNSHVRNWIASSFPILLIDEGQDLSVDRLQIIINLQDCLCLLIAADEFQCLDDRLRPNPLASWLPGVCEPIELTVPRRTNLKGLLDAGLALRTGKSPVVTKNDFKIVAAPGIPMSATYVCNAIAWGGTKDIAVLTPSNSGGYAKNTITMVTEKACGKKQNGPYKINRELSDEDRMQALLNGHSLVAEYSIKEALDFLQTLDTYNYIIRSTIAQIARKSSIQGANRIEGKKIREIMLRFTLLQRQRWAVNQTGIKAMSIHQAKNREFDGVIVLWPFTVAGDDEHKRRLLYNAITRAKKWCLVLVQNQSILLKAPFSNS